MAAFLTVVVISRRGIGSQATQGGRYVSLGTRQQNSAPLPATRTYTDFLLRTASLDPVGHTAAALGTPTIALFGSTDGSRHGPEAIYGGPHRTVAEDIDCAPCHQKTCPLGHHRCMLELAPEKVYGIADALLGVDESETAGLRSMN